MNFVGLMADVLLISETSASRKEADSVGRLPESTGWHKSEDRSPESTVKPSDAFPLEDLQCDLQTV